MMIFWEIDNYTLDIHSILEAKFRNNLCTKKLSFSLRISSVNVTKSAGNCEIWSHLLKKSLMKPSSHLYLLQQRDYIATDLIFALTIFMMGGGGGVGAKGPFPKICQTYPTMMKLGTVIPYLKKIQKVCKSCDPLLEFC